MSLLNIWNYDCPRCRKSKIFTKPFDPFNPLSMPKNCTHCGLKMEPEPGYYYGAMFLSYILSGFFLLFPSLFLIFYLKWTVAAAMVFVIVLAVFSYFRFLRLSRSLWLSLNIKYDPKYQSKTWIR